MRKFFLFFLILIVLSSSAYAIPELPEIVSGTVLINEKPAKIGTIITAESNGKVVAEAKTAEEGKFTLLLQKLNEGDNVKLFVDGIDTKENIAYKSGDFRQLNLKVEKIYLYYYLIGGLIVLLAILVIWRIRKK